MFACAMIDAVLVLITVITTSIKKTRQNCPFLEVRKRRSEELVSNFLIFFDGESLLVLGARQIVINRDLTILQKM